jgi:hypothetical protein
MAYRSFSIMSMLSQVLQVSVFIPQNNCDSISPAERLSSAQPQLAALSNRNYDITFHLFEAEGDVIDSYDERRVG